MNGLKSNDITIIFILLIVKHIKRIITMPTAARRSANLLRFASRTRIIPAAVKTAGTRLLLCGGWHVAEYPIFSKFNHSADRRAGLGRGGAGLYSLAL